MKNIRTEEDVLIVPKALIDRGVSFTVVLIYSYLYSNSKNKICHKSYSDIMEFFRLSRMSVYRAIKILVEFNCIELKENTSRRYIKCLYEY